MAIKVPPPQVCPLHGHDDDVSIVPGGSTDEWVYVCTGHTPPHNWSVKIPNPSKGREGIMAELGLYDDLLACIHPGEPWVEHGIVEYRYWHFRPEIYLKELVARYGHRANGPRHFSASAVIGKALGQLRDEGLLAWQVLPATAFWRYNGTISFWATLPPPPESEVLTWEGFAADSGLDPDTWELPQP